MFLLTLIGFCFIELPFIYLNYAEYDNFTIFKEFYLKSDN